jgi:hypothetical protein
MELVTRIAATVVLACAVAATSRAVVAEDGEVALVRLLQANVELRGQVADLTRSVDAVKSELEKLRVSVQRSGKAAPVAVSQPEKKMPHTAVCPCQRGAGERGCFCLKKGQQCGCPTKGSSVWTVDASGRPVAKTGERVPNGQRVTQPSRPVQPARQPQRATVQPPTQMVQLPWAYSQQGHCPNCVRQWRYRSDD